MTPAQAGQLGGLERWGKTPDRTAATAPARKAAEARWEREVRSEFPDLDDALVIRLAESRRKAHFVRMGRASAAARKRKAAQKPPIKAASSAA